MRKPGSDYDGGGVKSEIVLRDGGSGYPDITARDGVYTGYLTDYSPESGFYALSVRATDNEGRAQVRIHLIRGHATSGLPFMPPAHSGVQAVRRGGDERRGWRGVLRERAARVLHGADAAVRAARGRRLLRPARRRVLRRRGRQAADEGRLPAIKVIMQMVQGGPPGKISRSG